MIVDLVRATDVDKYGGKAVNLQKLLTKGFTVPSGFVVSTESEALMTEELQNTLLHFFDQLDSEYVAVRSSAVVEDGDKDSWAGQLETYLNVSRKLFVQAVEDCWLSARSERALAYSKQAGTQLNPANVAVIVQSMIDSDTSGVAFSSNPVTNIDEIVIEAGYGLGEAVVSGTITPDNYTVDKVSGLVDRHMSLQSKMLVRVDGISQWQEVDKSKQSVQKLTDEHIRQLAEEVIKIEKYYEKPMDIEWAFKNDKLYITQARPITTFQ